MLICGEEAGKKCSCYSNFSDVSVAVGHGTNAVDISRFEKILPE